MVDMFFFKQKTAYEMRISDWSSDVCSSDLDADRDTEIADQRGDGQRSEIAINHGRDAGEDLEDRLQPRADGLMGILGQEDGAHQPKRDGHDHGDRSEERR